ncbi:MAG: ATP-binding cassette domain-containing protein [Nitrospira sp.]|nr:MAG: ATP-binding cassette domain-containing protein [Nitrospira sp.]
MPSLLDIKNATVYRGATPVFDGLTLEIAEGCHTVLLGPNGSGKTTLLKLFTRELYPVPTEESHVRLFGQDNWNVWELRARLGLVSSDLQQDYVPWATGLDVVLSGFRASNGVWPHQKFSDAETQRATVLLKKLAVPHLADRPYGAMSTGQQRRLLLGRALVHDPGTLILDEPTTGLDLPAAFHYLDVIRDLIRTGKTILLATHHIHEIPPEIERVVLLKDGKIFADGARATVLTSTTLSLLFEAPIELVQMNGCLQAFPANRTNSGSRTTG